MSHWRERSRTIALGLGIGVLGWVVARESVRPPKTWLRIYVRSGCGASQQAIADTTELAHGLPVALLPLDEDAGREACPLTLARLRGHRPWLAVLPEPWACRMLVEFSGDAYETLAIEREAVPVYQLGDSISLGWNEARQAALAAGLLEDVVSAGVVVDPTRP